MIRAPIAAALFCLAVASPAVAQEVPAPAQQTEAPPSPQDQDASPSTADMAPPQEPEAITATGFPEGTQFATAFESSWTIGHTDKKIRIPDGFVTDYASIPASLQGLLATQGSYSRAAVIHDYLYWTHACTRLQSDNLLMIAMTESHVPTAQRLAIYNGVRVGGSAAWAANAQQRQQGLGRFVPLAYRSMLNEASWETVRQHLAALHVPEPPVTITEAICLLGNSTAVP